MILKGPGRKGQRLVCRHYFGCLLEREKLIEISNKVAEITGCNLNRIPARAKLLSGFKYRK